MRVRMWERKKKLMMMMITRNCYHTFFLFFFSPSLASCSLAFLFLFLSFQKITKIISSSNLN